MGLQNRLNISLIVPFYNDAIGIEKLLNSIDNGCFFKEVIIVDDNSDTLELRKVKQRITNLENVKLLKNNTSTKGAGTCRNIGIENATSKWLVFADSDDNFLKDYVKNMEKYVNSSADIVYFPPQSSNQNGDLGTRHLTYKTYFNYYWKHDQDEMLLRYKLEVIWSRMLRSSFVRKNNLKFDEIMSSNDKMFAISAGILAEKIIVSKDNIYSWNYRTDSITTKITKERFADTVNVSIRVNKILKDYVSKKCYKKVSTTSTKLLALSLLRNKFGIKYTFNLLRKLNKNKMPFFTINDLERINNFFINNKYYK